MTPSATRTRSRWLGGSEASGAAARASGETVADDRATPRSSAPGRSLAAARTSPRRRRHRPGGRRRLPRRRPAPARGPARACSRPSGSTSTASSTASLCRWGYMLAADPPPRWSGRRRQSCRGGRFALAAWGSPETPHLDRAAALVVAGLAELQVAPGELGGAFAGVGTALEGCEESPVSHPGAEGPRLVLAHEEDGDALVDQVLDLEDKEALLRSDPEVFFTTPHYDVHALRARRGDRIGRTSWPSWSRTRGAFARRSRSLSSLRRRVLRRRRRPLPPRRQDRRDPRLRLAGSRAFAEPQGLRGRRRRRPARGLASVEKARAPGSRSTGIADAASRGDIVMVLLPDEKHGEVYRAEIADGIAPGNLLLFGHGFSIHYGEIEPPPEVDVALVAPKGPATSSAASTSRRAASRADRDPAGRDRQRQAADARLRARDRLHARRA